MVAAAGFTRPPGTAAVCRGVGSLMRTVLGLICAAQVAAMPITLDNKMIHTNNHNKCCTIKFMADTNHTTGVVYEYTDTAPTYKPTAQPMRQTPLLVNEPRAPRYATAHDTALSGGLAYADKVFR